MRVAGVLALGLVVGFGALADEPLHLYLTWQGDTSTTMTVNFHTPNELQQSQVYYDKESRGGNILNFPNTVNGDSRLMEGLRETRWIHTVELTGLEPNTRYYFIAGDGGRTMSREYSFLTAPAGDEPIRFISGGDMNVVRGARELLEEAGKHDPLFGVIGGDLAYADGDLRSYRKWDRWFENWAEFLTLEDGRMVPMVVGIGNHEVDGGYGQPKEKAPFFFGYFAQAEDSFFSLRFGKNVVIVMLDTGHVASHESQARWLDDTLTNHADVRHKMAVYHVPLYPSHRNFMDQRMIAGRTHWAPLFDKHQLLVAFENHDHTHKRTPRIKGNRIHPDGTLYLGDGAFGVPPRAVDEERRWYEEVATSTPHFWLVHASKDAVTFEAIDKDGNVFDRVTLPSR